MFFKDMTGVNSTSRLEPNLHWTGNYGTGIVFSFFLSLDTESINFDHHLRCGGWLNFEFR